MLLLPKLMKINFMLLLKFLSLSLISDIFASSPNGSRVYLATIVLDAVIQYRMTNHKLQILYNILLFLNEWADDFVSAIVLWFECFIAAGLSPISWFRRVRERERKIKLFMQSHFSFIEILTKKTKPERCQNLIILWHECHSSYLGCKFYLLARVH